MESACGIRTEFSRHSSQPKKMVWPGLSICRPTIELHRGSLWPQSGADYGTTFCFTLPVSINIETSFQARASRGSDARLAFACRPEGDLKMTAVLSPKR